MKTQNTTHSGAHAPQLAGDCPGDSTCQVAEQHKTQRLRIDDKYPHSTMVAIPVILISQKADAVTSARANMAGMEDVVFQSKQDWGLTPHQGVVLHDHLYRVEQIAGLDEAQRQAFQAGLVHAVHQPRSKPIGFIGRGDENDGYVGSIGTMHWALRVMVGVVYAESPFRLQTKEREDVRMERLLSFNLGETEVRAWSPIPIDEAIQSGVAFMARETAMRIAWHMAAHEGMGAERGSVSITTEPEACFLEVDYQVEHEIMGWRCPLPPGSHAAHDMFLARAREGLSLAAKTAEPIAAASTLLH